MRPAAAGFVALLLGLGLVGCTSSDPKADLRPTIVRAGQTWRPRELELSEADERQIEAHARFAAGVIEDLGDATDAAIAHYQAAIANDPDNEILTLDVARKLVGLRRLEDARLLLDASTKRPTASGLVWGWLGTVYSLQGNPKAAIAANREAIRRTPGNISGYQNLARIYVEGGQTASAVAVLEEAAAQPGADAGFLILLAETLGAIRSTGGEGIGDLRPRVLALLDRAAELNPQDPDEVLRLADLYQLNGAGGRSLPFYERLLQSHPDLPGLRERMAEAYLRADNREKATEQLNVLSARHPTSPYPHYLLGMIAIESKKFEEAITAFRRALVLKPDDPLLHQELALAHLANNQAAAALEVLGRARARFRPTFELEFYTAAAMSELKRYEEAIRHYTAAEVIAGATAPRYLT
ncbi:MAG: tetratricopeptide repeat protein, partial [Verrucomicrobiales bacterium]|nr:tetratricopeptide repeat protein [Verrucomicrobiales bacterium]